MRSRLVRELTELPALVDGHRGQLREVILNLVHNALEAMDTTTDRSRVLRVTTAASWSRCYCGCSRRFGTGN